MFKKLKNYLKNLIKSCVLKPCPCICCCTCLCHSEDSICKDCSNK